ncbi:AMP phosphorylase [Candidatus Micrarchaeota archaeon]|nr:AMP phosphorylase [Candidatus Micrarchaeota archaeon]
MSVDKAEVFNLKEWTTKVKAFDIIAGGHIILLNEEEAMQNGVYPNYRVELHKGKERGVAVVDLTSELVKPGEIGIFKEVAADLKLKNGDKIHIHHITRPPSLDHIKKKMDGNSLKRDEVHRIIKDLMDNYLSQAELSAFITSVYIRGLTDDEVIYLTEAISQSGDILDIGKKPVVDKHSIGGVTGRVTMVMVPILAAAGLWVPKTSSRSITSAAGTADAMEVLAPVDIGIEELKEVVLKTNGAIVWGGGMNLAAADDKLIQIRHPFSLDPKGILLASILSKKKAVGADNVVVDLPIGRGAKIQDAKVAKALARDFIDISKRLDMRTEVLITDGSDPIGTGIGPALECVDVFKVLEGEGPRDLRDKSCVLTAKLFEMTGKAKPGAGFAMAEKLIDSGKALSKFREIIESQGGNGKIRIDDLPIGSYKHEIIADKSGRVHHVDNKILSHLARAAGAPIEKGAGLRLHCERGDKVYKGSVLFEIYAESESKLDFAIKAYEGGWNPIELQKIVLDSVK